MEFLDADQLEVLLPFPELIDGLQRAFAENYNVPLRHHHDYRIPGEAEPGTLLLMPAWDDGQYFGVKLVAASPHNRWQGLPTIQGIYTLFETQSGTPILQMDAKALTNLRTAAASALASTFLSRPDSRTLLMIGTGALAPYLIRAHAAVRPIERVVIWGRNTEKADKLATGLQSLQHPVSSTLQYASTPVLNLSSAMAAADIISCATMSTNPLILGQWLQPGQHVDLVGSYKPNMREADDEAIRRATVYVDTMEGALKETGDIVAPVKNGILRPENIPGDLFSLCRREAPGRQSPDTITIFKSVGHALEDLAAAKMAWDKVG
ncbi:MAG: ornithine cyclodeaminase family protein [Phaeodactylibacter sp.]|nr:ornithine cyclodeaminase family protein [Phaeodactylibacter sp.]MCB9293329.1 ornithine cyclodeaminase family protein [Lewinellaceae bacterium]